MILDIYKYRINYGFGVATLWTPLDPTERFYTLAGTCFGIRKSIMYCNILSKEPATCDTFERLEYGGVNGDAYVWRHDGARMMLNPPLDEDWDEDFCELCKPKEAIEVLYADDKPCLYAISEDTARKSVEAAKDVLCTSASLASATTLNEAEAVRHLLLKRLEGK